MVPAACPADGHARRLRARGFWRARWDRGHAEPLAEALAAEGHLVSLPEYRRVGSPGWGGYRDTLADVAAAVSLPAPELAPPVRRTVFVGHSAGGHLALWAGFRAPLRPDAVVALAGCVDLRLVDEWHLGDDAVVDLMGVMPRIFPSSSPRPTPRRRASRPSRSPSSTATRTRTSPSPEPRLRHRPPHHPAPRTPRRLPHGPDLAHRPRPWAALLSALS
ncbi:alpha/beta hydrolase [Streptacidiphilus monticola]